MAIRPAPKRKSVDYEKIDDLQKKIFGSEQADEILSDSKSVNENLAQTKTNSRIAETSETTSGKKVKEKTITKKIERESLPSSTVDAEESATKINSDTSPSVNLSDLETIAARIASSKAGQGRNTTRPFSLPRTLIIDTTRLKSKFRTIDEQFTQNVIVDFLLREALAAVSPENYKNLRTTAFESVKKPDETTRRSLTVTEEVVYQMSELKAGINLETGKKYSNDEIFSTLLAIGVSWLYQNEVLT